MADIGDQLARFVQACPNVKWVMLLAGFALSALVLYKLSVTRTIGQNGRVTTRYRLPFAWPRYLDRYLTLERRHYKPWQKTVLKVLYSGQEFLFGILLFVFGLALFGTGGVHTLDGAAAFFQWRPLLTTALGLFFMAWGVWVVIYRNRHNPFVNPDEQQSR